MVFFLQKKRARGDDLVFFFRLMNEDGHDGSN